VPCPQPLFSAVKTDKTASEGKVDLLTVPLSGRNGRFFLTEFSVSLGLAHHRFTGTERRRFA